MKRKLNTKIIRMVRPLFMIMLIFLLLGYGTYSWIRRDNWHATLDGQAMTITAGSGIESLSADIIYKTTDLQNFAPGTPVPFTISLTNESSKSVSVSLSIAEMVVNNPVFLDVISISLSGGTGFADGAVRPLSRCLNEATTIGLPENHMYSLPLYTGQNTLTIPADSKVELVGYLEFSEDAVIPQQNMSLQIKLFRLEG